MESLAAILQRYRLDSMLSEAQLIRDFPECQERTDEARKLIRFVLYEFALGKIDAATRDQICDTLHFAAERLELVHEQPASAYQEEVK